MTYSKINITKGENAGAGSDIKGKAYIVDITDVISGFERDADGITISGNLVLKSGAVMQTVEFTKNTLKNTSKSEGDVDAKGTIQGCEFEHPGNTVAIRAFRRFWMNKDIVIIYEHCDPTKNDDLYGSICSPMQMNYDANEDKDKNNTKFTFVSTNKGPEVAVYLGTKTVGSDTVVAADTVTIDVTNGPGRYQLTTNTAAKTLLGLSNMVHNGVYTLIGSGGTYPASIPSGGLWILKDGSSWSGISGSSITFRGYKNGASTWNFIEQSRT